ncbi:MAG: hypothetical protein KatS3mg065_0560 [Chloroflexota bacterium]|nr:MAG: hypothetical protein KatS3mg065_0560 [Chloroflexota bacterium]
MVRPYRLRRLSARIGQGPETVYRAVSTDNQPLLQQPMKWVRLQGAYRALAECPTPRMAAALAAAGVPNVAKVWTELAYEAVRQQIARELPSRLDSLYAFADPFEALSFTEVTSGAHQVWEGEVPEGVTWAAVDMSAFGVVRPETPDPAGYAEAWRRATEQARRYWVPGDEIQVQEILVAGELRLTRQVRLLPLLTELGLLQSDDRSRRARRRSSGS